MVISDAEFRRQFAGLNSYGLTGDELIQVVKDAIPSAAGVIESEGEATAGKSASEAIAHGVATGVLTWLCVSILQRLFFDDKKGKGK